MAEVRRVFRFLLRMEFFAFGKGHDSAREKEETVYAYDVFAAARD